MPQLRKDPVTSRWVIVNVENPKTEFEVVKADKSSRVCPFCPGNEAMTPPEIAAYGRKGGKGPWQVRVVPNKFPALRIEETTQKTAIGIYDKIGGFGAHEVIVETPDHKTELADLAPDHFETVLRAYRDRCADLRKDPRIRYVLLFKNYGHAAGASLEHPHSQLIALPIVPSRVQGEVRGAHRHLEFTERCIFCDMIAQDDSEKRFTVISSDGFRALCPFASRFPFEMWVMPERHEPAFEALSDEGLHRLAKVLQGALARLKKTLGDPSYNFMVHTIPAGSREPESFHWHIEIIPHLTSVAGFELGTGFYVNPTPPEAAAKLLRGEKTK